MIIIDEINEPEYTFPTIDFKFQNSGTATAFLWQFGVTVLSAEVDRTPVLKFRPKAEDGVLTIAVCNNGWGAARNVSLRFEEDTLSEIFAEASLRYQGAIESGAQVTAYRLSISAANPSRLRRVIRTHFVSLDDGFSYRHGSDPNDMSLGFGIRLKDATVAISFLDEKGNEHAKDETVSFEHIPVEDQSVSYGVVSDWIALTPEGFVEFRTWPCPAEPALSSITYISLIDPSRGPHERVYRMSRKIPPGDVERFHIMVGASKSCHLRIKFRFFIDKESIVESEEFEMHVWLPRNQQSRLRTYIDGSEVQRGEMWGPHIDRGLRDFVR
jgi:hypothetical protein